jgi:hypothetical protein
MEFWKRKNGLNVTPLFARSFSIEIRGSRFGVDLELPMVFDLFLSGNASSSSPTSDDFVSPINLPSLPSLNGGFSSP